MKKSIFVYPWDIVDEGIENFADNLVSFGFDCAIIAASYHRARVLVPHNPKRHTYIHNDDYCYYSISKEKYFCLKPQLNPEFPPDFLSSVVTTLHSRGISTAAWIVVFHNSSLAQSNPDCSITNCYGESSPNCLCPSNEKSFEYALMMLEDAAMAGVDELCLESVDYPGYIHGNHHEMHAFSDTVLLDRLMGMCFCSSCMRLLEDNKENEKEILAHHIKMTNNFLAMNPVSHEDMAYLCKLDHLRSERISSFYIELKRRICNRGLTTKIKPILWLANGAIPLHSGIDFRLFSNVLDSVIACYPSTPDTVQEFLGQVESIKSGNISISGGVRLMAPNCMSEIDAMDYARAYKASGLSEVCVYNYGMTPLPFLQRFGMSI